MKKTKNITTKKVIMISVISTLITIGLIFGGIKFFQIAKEKGIFSKYYCWGENHILDEENARCEIPNVDYYVEQGYAREDLYYIFMEIPELAVYLNDGFSVNDISRMDLTYKAKKKGEKYYYCNDIAHNMEEHFLDEETNVCTVYEDNTKQKVKYTYTALPRGKDYPVCDDVEHEIDESTNTCTYVFSSTRDKDDLIEAGGNAEYTCPKSSKFKWTLEDKKCISQIVEFDIYDKYADNDWKWRRINDQDEVEVIAEAELIITCPDGYEKNNIEIYGCDKKVTYEAKTK